MNYYTYIYYDPSRSNEPIYIGKGKNSRAWQHLTRKDNHPLTIRLKSMSNNNIKPIIGFYSGMDSELALLVEEELIAKIGRKDMGLGPLLNLTDGGEGLINISESTRQKMILNAANRTEDHKKNLIEANRLKNEKGVIRNHSNETRLKMSLASSGKPKSDEHKAALVKARQLAPRDGPNKGGVMSLENKQKISVAKKGKPWTQARRDAQNRKGQ